MVVAAACPPADKNDKASASSFNVTSAATTTRHPWLGALPFWSEVLGRFREPSRIRQFASQCRARHPTVCRERYSTQATIPLPYKRRNEISKIPAALITTLFAATAFAADAPKTETKAPETKPAAEAPAKAEAKRDVKAPAAKETKTKAKSDAKTDAKTPEKHSKAAGHAPLAKKVSKKDNKQA